MSPNLKTVNTLQEDEIIKLLCKTPMNNYVDSSIILDLISVAYNSNNKNFRLYVIDYLKMDLERFIKLLNSWVLSNSTLVVVRTSIKVDDCEIKEPSNFIEESLVRLGKENIDRIFKLLESEVYKTRLCALKSLIYLLVKEKEVIFRDSFNKYVERIIDFCVKYFDDNLVKIEVSKFLGKIDSNESISMLEYFRDKEEDFTIKMVSIIGLNNIQKMNRSSINSNNSNIKNIILSYRR